MAKDPFRFKPGQTIRERFNEFMSRPHYGLTNTRLVGDDDQVDLDELLEALPLQTIKDDMLAENPARATVLGLVEDLPATLRAQGVRVHADAVVQRVRDRDEYYGELLANVTRICHGGPKRDQEHIGDDGEPAKVSGCPHWTVCPFRDIVKNVKPEQGLSCSHERRLVKAEIKQWIEDPKAEGGEAKVENRAEARSHFEQYLKYVVYRERYGMDLSVAGIRVPRKELGYKNKGAQSAMTVGDQENPMVSTYIKLGELTLKTLRLMGLEPRDMKIRGEWISDAEREDVGRAVAQEAANAMMLQARRMEETLEAGKQELLLLEHQFEEERTDDLGQEIADLKHEITKVEGMLEFARATEGNLRKQKELS